MATSSVVIAGATYSDVPSVTLKDTSNTDVSFVLTTDADATASDIRKNKIAYSQGQKIVGDYELNLQEKKVTPTTSTQVVTADSSLTFTAKTTYTNANSRYAHTISLSSLDGYNLLESALYKVEGTIEIKKTGLTSNVVTIDSFVSVSTNLGGYDGLLNREQTQSSGSLATSTISIGNGVLSVRFNSSVGGVTIDTDLRFYDTGERLITSAYAHDGSSGDYKTIDLSSVENGETLYVYGHIGTDTTAAFGGGRGTANNISFTYDGTNKQIDCTYDQSYDVSGNYYFLLSPSTSRIYQYNGNSFVFTLFRKEFTPSNYDGLSQVTVNPIPSEYIIPSGTLSVTNNGTVDVSAYQYAEVNVSSGSQTQSKTATPTTSTQTITPDSGYLLSSVVVNPIPSNYIDTTDATASASDIRNGASAYVNGSKVNGSLVVNTVYVGSTDPSSSFGNDGDIYIKVV